MHKSDWINKRNKNSLLQDVSQHSFHDSAQKALAATKHADGSLRMNTPIETHQSKKMASLKQQLSKLNSMSYSMRPTSGLAESSVASFTAATSFAPQGSGCSKILGTRPNSNMSNWNETRDARARLNYKTDLTRFSQNTHSKDLSPMRVSHLTASEAAYMAVGKENAGRRAEAKTDLQALRKHSDFGVGHGASIPERVAQRDNRLRNSSSRDRNI